MRLRQVLCPACGTILDVPLGKSDCFVRCGSCHFRFRLPKRIAVTDDAVTDWLDEGKTQEQEHAAKRELRLEEIEAASSGTAVLPAISDIRLVKSDSSGALLEFPTTRLNEPAFRCAMPRKCLRCGGKQNLAAHAIIYATSLIDAQTLEAEHAAGTLVLKGPGVADLSNDEVLKAMSNVPNIPAPANQPMPFWLCDMCTTGDLISGQMRIGSEGVGLCRLWIGNLRRAEEFLVAAGGKNTPGYVEIHRRIIAVTENPWSCLPLAVQNRIQQWYRPGAGEHFLAYIADRDRARSEEGLAGILISDKRVIFHTMVRHKEGGINEKLEFQEVFVNERQCIQVKASGWEFRYLAVDREGLALLKHALVKSKANAVWR